jgi:hypothetical protein
MPKADAAAKKAAHKRDVRARAKAAREAEAVRKEQLELATKMSERLFAVGGCEGPDGLGRRTARWNDIDFAEMEEQAFVVWLRSQPDHAARAAALERGFILTIDPDCLDADAFHDTVEADAFIGTQLCGLYSKSSILGKPGAPAISDADWDMVFTTAREHDKAREESLDDELFDLLCVWRRSDEHAAWYEREVGWKQVRPNVCLLPTCMRTCLKAVRDEEWRGSEEYRASMMDLACSGGGCPIANCQGAAGHCQYIFDGQCATSWYIRLLEQDPEWAGFEPVPAPMPIDVSAAWFDGLVPKRSECLLPTIPLLSLPVFEPARWAEAHKDLCGPSPLPMPDWCVDVRVNHLAECLECLLMGSPHEQWRRADDASRIERKRGGSTAPGKREVHQRARCNAEPEPHPHSEAYFAWADRAYPFDPSVLLTFDDFGPLTESELRANFVYCEECEM